MTESFYIAETKKFSNRKLFIALLAVMAAFLSVLFQGYNILIHSICFGTFLFLIYDALVSKEPGETHYLYFALRIWVSVTITLYLGILSGAVFSIIRAEESIELVKTVGEVLISLKNPIMIFLFNLPKGLLGAIPYAGPFIIGVAGGNSGFIMGTALYHIFMGGEEFRAIITSLIAFHPYGFLEILSYSMYITASLYARRRMWGDVVKIIGIATLLLVAAAYLEFWEVSFLSKY